MWNYLRNQYNRYLYIYFILFNKYSQRWDTQKTAVLASTRSVSSENVLYPTLPQQVLSLSRPFKKRIPTILFRWQQYFNAVFLCVSPFRSMNGHGTCLPKTVQCDMLGSPSKKGDQDEKETVFRRTNCQNFAWSRKQEKPIAEFCKLGGFSEQSYYRWKKKFGDMSVPDVKRLRALEKENTQLKRLLAERDLEVDALKAVVSKKG